ncbi:hypothetical protein Tco_1299449, partial [Tanacetum coccineum]
MADNISPYLRIRLKNYLSYDLMAPSEIIFRKQTFEELMQAIKFVQTGNNARNDLLVKSKFLKCCLRDMREIGSLKIRKLILDQWELNKMATNVAKEVKRLKLEDKVSGERSKCVYCGNIWNKTFTSSSNSGITESNGGKSNTS